MSFALFLQPFLGWVVDNDFEGLAPLRLLSREREGPLWEVRISSFRSFLLHSLFFRFASGWG